MMSLFLREIFHTSTDEPFVYNLEIICTTGQLKID